MKLHLGCGDKHIPGWVHWDARPLPHVDRVVDVRYLPTNDGTVEVIYACHVLEHVGRRDVAQVLSEWHRVLMPGGILRVCVPDIAALFCLYMLTVDLSLLLGPLYGRQDYTDNTHRCGFDEPTLSAVLVEAGFSSPRRYDWRTTEHADLDDGSQHYHPHMDKDRGLLLSLNMEATA